MVKLYASESANPNDADPSDTSPNTTMEYIIENGKVRKVEYAFLQFDISGVNKPAIASCILHLFFLWDGEVFLQRSDDNISTSTTCWNNMPGVYATPVKSGGATSGETWALIDVLDSLQAESESYFCVRIRNNDSYKDWTKIASPFYYDATKKPYLEIIYTPVEINNIYVDPVNGSDSNPGTQLLPLASLSLAASRVIASGIINIKAGAVWRSSTGQIAPTNKPVTYYVY